MQIARIEANTEKGCQEVQMITNNIDEATLGNNCLFTEGWERTQEWIDCQADKHQCLKIHIIKLKNLSGLQQTTLQSCQNQIAGLEETVKQLVSAV